MSSVAAHIAIFFSLHCVIVLLLSPTSVKVRVITTYLNRLLYIYILFTTTTIFVFNYPQPFLLSVIRSVLKIFSVHKKNVEDHIRWVFINILFTNKKDFLRKLV